MPRPGINVHLASRSTLDLAVQAGFGAVRIDGNWTHVQPERGAWDWAELDESVHGAKARDLEVLLTLSQIPAWSNGGRGKNVPPIQISDWQVFVHGICERYREHIAVCEIWNEPNSFGYWTGSVEQYVDYLLKPAIEVIRAHAPMVKIAGPALSTEGAWPVWLNTMLSQSRQVIDIVSVHAYAKHGHAVWQKLMQDPRWWEIWKDPSIKRVIHEAGAGHLPFYLSEVGWNTADVSEAQQADSYDQLLERWTTQPWVTQVYGFHLIDEAYPVWWGVFREDRSPKPVIEVI